ncbi:MAG: patatin-like phospholipase family protein [Chloroflexi bacterium]|nr:patatin-like phospholipase family protein [Chloroflexota bacterium]
MTESSSPKRALVLSGGGGRGAFQVGVIEQLESIGWKPDIIIGTSIGSMNAAVYAVGGLPRLQYMWESIRTRDMQRVLRRPPWHSLFDRAPWKRTLEKYVPEHELAQVKQPLYMVATDITTGHPTVYTNGEKPARNKGLYQKVSALNHAHLLASSSIPYLYESIPVEGNRHWDGAVMYNSPLRPAIDAEADEILMVLLSPYHKLEENDPRPMVQRSALPPQPPGLIGSIGYVLDLALIGTFENDFEELRKVNRRVHQGHQAEADHREVRAAVIAPDDWITPLDIIRYRPDRIRALRDQGRLATQATFTRIQRLGWDSLYGVDE